VVRRARERGQRPQAGVDDVRGMGSEEEARAARRECVPAVGLGVPGGLSDTGSHRSGPGRVRARARGGGGSARTRMSAGALRRASALVAPVRGHARETEAPGWPVARRSPPDSHFGRARFRASWRAAERVAFSLTAPFRTGPPHQWSSTRARVKRASESVVRGLHFAPQWSAAFRVTAARKPRLPRRACIARRLAGEPPAGADGYFQRPAPAPLRCS